MSEATFWFTTVITVIILMIPVLAWRFYFVDVCPTLSDRVRLKQRLAQLRYVRSLLFFPAPRSGKKGTTIDTHVCTFPMFRNAKHNCRLKQRQRVASCDRKSVVHTWQLHILTVLILLPSAERIRGMSFCVVPCYSSYSDSVSLKQKGCI